MCPLWQFQWHNCVTRCVLFHKAVRYSPFLQSIDLCLWKVWCRNMFATSYSAFALSMSKQNIILQYPVVRSIGWSSNFPFSPQLLDQVLNITTCLHWVDFIATKEVKAYVCTSIVATQDDTLSREGQCSSSMWFAVVIIILLALLCPGIVLD